MMKCLVLTFGLIFSVGTAHAEIIYGMQAASSQSTAAGTNLVMFDSANPSIITTLGNMSVSAGIPAGHLLREISFRPQTGILYAISTDASFNAQIYTVNLATGGLTPQGATFALSGASSAIANISFNPVADRLQIITRGGQSYRWNPNTNAFQIQDANVAYASGDSPEIIGVAYSNYVAGATSTTLYSWDYNSDSLITVDNSQAFTVFDSSSDLRTFNAGLGLSFSPATGLLYATHDNPTDGTTMGLYTIDPVTGAQTPLGIANNSYGGLFIPSIAVAPIPEPTTIALTGAAFVGLGIRTWRKRRTK